jgi:hypothetical protein
MRITASTKVKYSLEMIKQNTNDQMMAAQTIIDKLEK